MLFKIGDVRRDAGRDFQQVFETSGSLATFARSFRRSGCARHPWALDLVDVLLARITEWVVYFAHGRLYIFPCCIVRLPHVVYFARGGFRTLERASGRPGEFGGRAAPGRETHQPRRPAPSPRCPKAGGKLLLHYVGARCDDHGRAHAAKRARKACSDTRASLTRVIFFLLQLHQTEWWSNNSRRGPISRTLFSISQWLQARERVAADRAMLKRAPQPRRSLEPPRFSGTPHI